MEEESKLLAPIEGSDYDEFDESDIETLPREQFLALIAKEHGAEYAETGRLALERIDAANAVTKEADP